ncbi:hypothetical protein [Amycolatopsis sp. NPDC054798]
MKTIAYLAATFAPPLGDLFSLADADAAAGRKLEQGIVAVAGLAGFAIGLTFPPVGVAVAVGVAVYSAVTTIIGFFRTRSRDWVEEPPGTLKELTGKGADIRWDSRSLNGKRTDLVFSNAKPVAAQKLLLNSKWAKRETGKTPISYTLSENPSYSSFILFPGIPRFCRALPIAGFSMTVWQDGKAVIPDECTTRYAPPGTPGSFEAEQFLECEGLSRRVTVSSGKPAVLEVRYVLGSYDGIRKICPAPPCALDKIDGHSEIHANADKKYVLNLPFTVGIA